MAVKWAAFTFPPLNLWNVWPFKAKGIRWNEPYGCARVTNWNSHDYEFKITRWSYPNEIPYYTSYVSGRNGWKVLNLTYLLEDAKELCEKCELTDGRQKVQGIYYSSVKESSIALASTSAS